MGGGSSLAARLGLMSDAAELKRINAKTTL